MPTVTPAAAWGWPFQEARVLQVHTPLTSDYYPKLESFTVFFVEKGLIYTYVSIKILKN